jgi:hypothetical protein
MSLLTGLLEVMGLSVKTTDLIVKIPVETKTALSNMFLVMRASPDNDVPLGFSYSEPTAEALADRCAREHYVATGESLGDDAFEHSVYFYQCKKCGIPAQDCGDVSHDEHLYWPEHRVNYKNIYDVCGGDYHLYIACVSEI